MANLIANGSFVDHADGWFSSDFEAVAFDGTATAGATGGCLSVGKPDGGTAFVNYQPGGVLAIPLGGLTTVDFVAVARSANTAAKGRVQASFYTDACLSSFLGTVSTASPGVALSDAGWVEVAKRGIAVPGGATHALLQLRSPNMDASPVRWDDVYFGAVAGDAPPYASAAPVAFPENRISNGDFEDAIDCWTALLGGETLSHETAAPLAGDGSLAAVVSGADAGQGVCSPAVVVRSGEALAISALVRCAAAVQLAVSYDSPSGTPTVLWTGTPGTATPVAATVTVPTGRSYVYVRVQTAGATPTTLWLDDVTVGPGAAVPPRSTAVLRAMASRRRRA